MTLGITGSRDGLSDAQLIALIEWVERNCIAEIHHGACLGADATAVLQAKARYGRACKAVAYPGHLPDMVSQPAMMVSDVRHPPEHTLKRNRKIVDACEVLLALPKGTEELKSGTWATARYGRKVGRRIIVIWPDGKVTEEGGR